MPILEAAADEICNILKGAERDSTPFTAKHFATVLYIARRAEEIACAEGRPDEIEVKIRAMAALEGKAPLTHAAIKDDLLGGDPALRAQAHKLEEERAAVRKAAAELTRHRENLQETVRAITSGDRILALSSGDSETGSETLGETATVPEYISPDLVPEETPELKYAFKGLPRSHEGDIAHEADVHKRDADRF